MLIGIVYRRLGGKDGGAKSLAPDAADIRYAVVLGIGPLLMLEPCLHHSYIPGEF